MYANGLKLLSSFGEKTVSNDITTVYGKVNRLANVKADLTR